MADADTAANNAARSAAVLAEELVTAPGSDPQATRARVDAAVRLLADELGLAPGAAVPLAHAGSGHCLLCTALRHSNAHAVRHLVNADGTGYAQMPSVPALAAACDPLAPYDVERACCTWYDLGHALTAADLTNLVSLSLLHISTRDRIGQTLLDALEWGTLTGDIPQFRPGFQPYVYHDHGMTARTLYLTASLQDLRAVFDRLRSGLYHDGLGDMKRILDRRLVDAGYAPTPAFLTSALPGPPQPTTLAARIAFRGGAGGAGASGAGGVLRRERADRR